METQRRGKRWLRSRGRREKARWHLPRLCRGTPPFQKNSFFSPSNCSTCHTWEGRWDRAEPSFPCILQHTLSDLLSTCQISTLCAVMVLLLYRSLLCALPCLSTLFCSAPWQAEFITATGSSRPVSLRCSEKSFTTGKMVLLWNWAVSALDGHHLFVIGATRPEKAENEDVLLLFALKTRGLSL